MILTASLRNENEIKETTSYSPETKKKRKNSFNVCLFVENKKIRVQCTNSKNLKNGQFVM